MDGWAKLRRNPVQDSLILPVVYGFHPATYSRNGSFILRNITKMVVVWCLYRAAYLF